MISLAAWVLSERTSAQTTTSPGYCDDLGSNAVFGSNCVFRKRCFDNTKVPPSPRLSPSTPRGNCTDLNDLPLCSSFSNTITDQVGSKISANAVVGANFTDNSLATCANACSDVSDPKPGENCIATTLTGLPSALPFCNKLPAGTKRKLGQDPNCVLLPYCQNLPLGTLPVSTGSDPNCTILPCNKLTASELADPRINVTGDKSGWGAKYCDGTNLKCSDLPMEKLFVITKNNSTLRDINPICQLHECVPPGATLNTSTNQISTSNNTGELGEIKAAKSPAYFTEYAKRLFNCTDTKVINPATRAGCVIPTSSYNEATDLTANLTANPPIPAPSPLLSFICFKPYDGIQSPLLPASCTSAANADRPECLEEWFYRPTPAWKAIRTSVTGKQVLGEIITEGLASDKLCFPGASPGLQDRGWGWDGVIIPGLPGLGYFHSGWLPDHSRSPGLCSATNQGGSGKGYVYLCGVQGNRNNMPSDGAAYIKGNAIANYGPDKASSNYVLNVNLRFKNALGIDELNDGQACGKRECAITCSFGSCWSQVCGDDYETTLTIGGADGDDTKCQIGGPMGSCAATVHGNFLRVRAVKYGNQLCAFMDTNGQTAHQGQWANAQETFFNGTNKVCITGTMSADGTKCDNGIDSNSGEGGATSWRTVKFVENASNYGNRPPATIPFIRYIGNLNKVGGDGYPEGYYHRSGRFFRTQDCARLKLRLPPPLLYNLANDANSPKMFGPQLFIKSVRKIKGADAAPVGVPPDKKTDFHLPEIELGFGKASDYSADSTTAPNQLSTILIYLNPDEVDGSSNTITDATTPNTTDCVANSNTSAHGRGWLKFAMGSTCYTAKFYIVKESIVADDISVPVLCLYKFKLDNTTTKIGCVERNAPEINSSFSSSVPEYLAHEGRRVIISGDRNNGYANANEAIIKLQYLYSDGDNNRYEMCGGDDSCISEVQLTNLNSFPSGSDCINKEGFPLCVQRDVCSELNFECVTNEVNYRKSPTARPAGFNDAKYLIEKKKCDALKVGCGLKKSIPGDITSERFYGWFNEICYVKGFETKLRDVVTYNTTGTGKCIIDEAKSRALNPSINPSVDCAKGGNARLGCVCQEATADIKNKPDELAKNNLTYRKETWHEAGLCVDIPLYPSCPAITFTPTPNTDTIDPDYISQSISNTDANYNQWLAGSINYLMGSSDDKSDPYEDTIKVHTTHRDRRNGTKNYQAQIIAGGTFNSPINTGHADLPQAFIGESAVNGICRGFWDNTGASPVFSCSESGGKAIWSQVSPFSPCPANNCDAITYSDNLSPADLDKAIGDGFASWPSVISGDFINLATATKCVTGYKTKDSVAKDDGTLNTDGSKHIVDYGIFADDGHKISYGTLPIRGCDQLGRWIKEPRTINGASVPPLKNSCQRITCPPTTLSVNPPSDGASKSESDAFWGRWNRNGGAVFPATDDKGAPITYSASTTNTGAVYTGKCQRSLGFFELSRTNADGSTTTIQPTRACDNMGNWLPVQNHCQTHCGAVEDKDANHDSGWATWKAVDASDLSSHSAFEMIGCKTGYVPNPYYPAKKTTRQCLPQVGSASTIYDYAWGAVDNPCVPEGKCPGYDPTKFDFDPINGVTNLPLSSSRCCNKTTGDCKMPFGKEGTPEIDICTQCTSQKCPAERRYFVHGNSHDEPDECCTTLTSGDCQPPLINCPNKCDSNGCLVDSGYTMSPLTINWPTTTFGKDAYAYNGDHTDNSSLYSTTDFLAATLHLTEVLPPYFDAFKTNFQDGRTDGKFLVKRHCIGDEDPDNKGKWQEGAPVTPMCYVNNVSIQGVIYSGNADYSGAIFGVCDTAHNYVKVDPEAPASSIFANCTNGDSTIAADQANFYNGVNGKLPYIDKTGLHPFGKACKKVCSPPANGDRYGNSIFSTRPGLKSQYDVGETINVSCASNYGYHVVSGSSRPMTGAGTCSNVDYGSLTTNRISTPPFITCGEDGQWSVGNDCTACNPCDDNSYVYYGNNPLGTLGNLKNVSITSLAQSWRKSACRTYLFVTACCDATLSASPGLAWNGTSSYKCTPAQGSCETSPGVSNSTSGTVCMQAICVDGKIPITSLGVN